MDNKKKYLPVVSIIGAVWLSLAIWSWAKAPKAFSFSERRKLEQFPAVSVDSVLDGEFMPNFEKYTLDQFPLRDSFRTLKGTASFYLFGQKDNNKIYIADGYAAKLEYPLNEKSLLYAAEKFTALYNTYLKDKNTKVYFSVVPDKSYFLAAPNGYPSLDYPKLFATMQENLTFAQYIDITGELKISDYYKTDTHWRQEKLTGVAEKLKREMLLSPTVMPDYSLITPAVPFYGVYYSQSALPLKSESLIYMTDPILEQCTVFNAETGKTGGIYDLAKLTGNDAYEVFLSGAAALLTIENPNAGNDRELVVFRDSFGSSLIPLLAQGYAKTTLIDTRYLASDYVGKYVTFADQDVLFLYSTLILNNSQSLK